MSISITVFSWRSRLSAAWPMSVALACAYPTVVASPVAGVVVGQGYYRHAKVCIDHNGNARCDKSEPAVYTDVNGRFQLMGGAALVAEVGLDATLVTPSTGQSTPVKQALVFRAPASAAVVVGPLSTEIEALREGSQGYLEKARQTLAKRLGVDVAQLLADPNTPASARQAVLMDEQVRLLARIATAVEEAAAHGDRIAALNNRLDLQTIQNVVVIFAENRSFENLFGNFPGANGVARARKESTLLPQRDRDGSILPVLPPAWQGLTAPGQILAVTQAQTTNIWPNEPFKIDSPTPAWKAPVLPNSIITRDLHHRFFENQMQINGGRNDMFASWADAGGLAMGSFDGTQTELWKIAQQYTLADNFFQGAFGGSFLNHQYLICACVPEYPHADVSPAHPSITALATDSDGTVRPVLALAPNSPPSALAGPPVFLLSANLTPKNYFGDASFGAVNTMQPPYQPSGNPPASDDSGGQYANPLAATTLPVQTATHIGDQLDQKKLSWTWYAGGWNAASADRKKTYNAAAGNFQAHHQPFNYYAGLDPQVHLQERATHLKDYQHLIDDAAAGTLPTVAFYKPIGIDNQHPGYASVAQGDAHIARVLAALRAGPQWKNMLVVVTYDENGGQWDPAAPPAGDKVGPGTRVPALLVSPYVKRGFVDHTQYDTASILRFIAQRYSLPNLIGVKKRDAALIANGAPSMGDLTNALDFGPRRAAK